MGPSEKSFNQVKAILGKLDRNIDQLRAARVTPVPAIGPGVGFLPAAVTQPQPAIRPGGAAFGKATPLPPRD